MKRQEHFCYYRPSEIYGIKITGSGGVSGGSGRSVRAADLLLFPSHSSRCLAFCVLCIVLVHKVYQRIYVMVIKWPDRGRTMAGPWMDRGWTVGGPWVDLDYYCSFHIERRGGRAPAQKGSLAGAVCGTRPRRLFAAFHSLFLSLRTAGKRGVKRAKMCGLKLYCLPGEKVTHVSYACRASVGRVCGCGACCTCPKRRKSSPISVDHAPPQNNIRIFVCIEERSIGECMQAAKRDWKFALILAGKKA